MSEPTQLIAFRHTGTKEVRYAPPGQPAEQLAADPQWVQVDPPLAEAPHEGAMVEDPALAELAGLSDEALAELSQLVVEQPPAEPTPAPKKNR